jgi:hypothetical protein
VQHHLGHGLLLFELVYFVSELLHLPLQVIFRLRVGRLRCGVVASHESDAEEQTESQNSFEHALPEGTDWLFSNLMIAFGHESIAGCAIGEWRENLAPVLELWVFYIVRFPLYGS